MVSVQACQSRLPETISFIALSVWNFAASLCVRHREIMSEYIRCLLWRDMVVIDMVPMLLVWHQAFSVGIAM